MSGVLAPGFLPLAAAAEWAGVSPRTLRRWFQSGLPRYQAPGGRKILLKPDDLEAFLVRKQQTPIDLEALADATMRELEALGRLKPAKPMRQAGPTKESKS